MWAAGGALISACSTWVDLETPKANGPPGAEAGEPGTQAGSGGSSNVAGRGVVTGGAVGGGAGGSGAVPLPASMAGQQGADTADQGGDSSIAGSDAGGPEPGLFEWFAVPAPVLIPPGAEAPGVTVTAYSHVYHWCFDGVLIGSVEHCFRTDPSALSCDWDSMEPFVWTEASGTTLLDQLLPGVFTYSAEFAALNGSTVIGTAASNCTEVGCDQDVYRWTRAGGATKLQLPTAPEVSRFESSEDGKTVALEGDFRNKPQELWLWTEASGWRDLGAEPGWPGPMSLKGISADGSAVVAEPFQPPATLVQSFRWTAGVGWESLGALPGLPNCEIDGPFIARDGKTIFGSCWAGAVEQLEQLRGFRWTEAGGMVALEDAAKSCSFYPRYGNEDLGSSILGMATCSGNPRLARWSSDGTLTLAPAAPQDSSIGAAGMDASGSTAFVPFCTSDYCDGFRWDIGASFVALSAPPGTHSVPIAIDPRGVVIVGALANQEFGHAALWDSNGALDIAAYLTARGVDFGDAALDQALDVLIQGDKIVVTGSGRQGGVPRDWIARIPLVR